jgi:hypothetical protein
MSGALWLNNYSLKARQIFTCNYILKQDFIILEKSGVGKNFKPYLLWKNISGNNARVQVLSTLGEWLEAN